MRKPWPVLAVLLLLAGFAGFAWLTRHPESPVVARATAWPVVGPAAAAFRERYLGHPTMARDLAAEGLAREPDGPAAVMRQGAELPGVAEPAGARPLIWVAPGDPLRQEPSDAAPAVAAVDRLANVPYLATAGDWRRIAWRGVEGWVKIRPEEEPPLGRAPDPVLPLPGRPPDPAALALARQLLGAPQRQATLGPYTLHTDVDEPALLRLLDAAAWGVEDAYRERYGLAPVGGPAEAVVLFRSCTAYAAFLLAEGGPEHAAGLVSRGVVALCRESRLIEDVRATLVHELLHLLNRRSLGPALPPWLDEGIADDLAQSRIEGRRLVPGSLAEIVLRNGPVWESHGALASADLLRRSRAAAAALPLADLLALDAEGFRAVDPPALAYAQSSFFVRFLLAGTFAPRFRSFLAGVAAGGPPSAAALEAALGASLAEVESTYARWLAASLPPAPG